MLSEACFLPTRDTEQSPPEWTSKESTVPFEDFGLLYRGRPQ